MKRRRFLLALALFLVLALAVIGATRASSQTLSPGTADVLAQPEPGALVDAIRQGKWPAQVAAHSGSIRPDRHGPQRNDPAEGIPTHAYSPFDERSNRDYPCPPGGCEFQKGRLLVKLAEHVKPCHLERLGDWTEDSTLNEALEAEGITRLEPIFPQARPPKPGEFVVLPQGERLPKPDLSRWYSAELQDEDADVRAIAQALSETPGIAWAEPDYLRKPVGAMRDTETGRHGDTEIFSPSPHPPISPSQIPGPGTDPLYAQQWHLDAANVPAAWQWLEDNGYETGGDRDIVVAVVDTGVDYSHPDLAANMWVNAPEFGGTPGVDDDGNGYVDDIHGADTVYPDGDPQDDHGHGTHVAGIVAAQANNGEGGVGVAYNVQLMALKAAQYSGVLAASDIAEAIYYAVEKGADVINMSFGGYARSQVEEDALAVAFGQAVLVAAAGNDAKVNLPCPFGRDMYPAAYNWVLGVMASQPSPGLCGWRACFSNYDCTPHDTHEYELLAPGVDVWSTLPIENYAACDGTSMAAPVVSGIAALLRTKWSDKDVYSSRFIMGQIASNASPVADAHAALTVAPQPELSYLEHWLFDTAGQSPDNDDDGIVDAGETVDLAIVIRNHWGKADPVTVTLEAWAEGAVFPDAYVTMITDTVDYGAVGSFNIDDNGLIYEDDVIVGVRHPFRFTVPITTPNDHVIPFLLTMTAGNGYDPDDPNAPYVFRSRFYLIVQRGTELPTIISEDMVLSKDYYWIVPTKTLVEPGVAVTITGGAQVQFWSASSGSPYSGDSYASLRVRGLLSVQGTVTEPVEMFLAPGFEGRITEILQEQAGGIDLSYAIIQNPSMAVDAVDHAKFQGSGFYEHGFYYNDEYINLESHHFVESPLIQQTTFDRVGIDFNVGSGSYFDGAFRLRPTGNSWSGSIRESLLDHSYFYFLLNNPSSNDFQNNVLLSNVRTNQGGNLRAARLWVRNQDPSGCSGDLNILHNAFLNNYHEPNPNNWSRVWYDEQGEPACLSQNYWGTTSTTIINAAIMDYYDDFDWGEILYQPILTSPVTTTYPFVADVVLSTASDPDASIVGAETVTFTVTFNRDMDPTVQPAVSFGPDVPETDCTVHPLDGGWQDPRTWAGTFNITPITGDGYQLMRVADAVAVDDPWLVTGDDAGRFRFEIITSGTEAMNLQATGGEGVVDLMWTQNDFELLAGFNLYRATSQEGSYSRINGSIIPPQVRAYQDTDVTPGQPYYYKFTIVKSDMTESDFSNVATATPIDTIPPVISHTPLTEAPAGLPLTVLADVTDNVGVQGVTLYYRGIGATDYLSKTMINTTGDRYSATLEGSLVTSPGLEYYIEADDGISTVRDGRPEYPHQVTVEDKPVITTVSPDHGPASGGTAVTISGSNFKDGASVTFGEAVAEDATVVSSSQITCTTPAHYPATVDVTVTNPDDQSGTLLRGFTYQSTAVQLTLPDASGGQHAVVQVPINAANVQGLLAADVTITFDAAVLEAQGASTGSLTPGWSMATNATTPGQVTLSLAGSGSVSGSGVLAIIEFEVLGAPGEIRALHFDSVLLNDGAIPADLTDGSFTINLVYDVSGTVSFWNGAAGVAGTTLTLKGDRIYTGESEGDGSYTVSSVPEGDYTLTPRKSDDATAISAYDASLVLQHGALLISLSGDAAAAADVNTSGDINSMDASYILQRTVDLIPLPFPGAGVVWDFDPASLNYTDLSSDQTAQDFTAVLLGDVSGNWSPAAAFSRRDGTRVPAVIRVQGSGTDALGSATATVVLEPVSAPITSLELTLQYDPQAVTALGVVRGSAAGGWMVASNLEQPGEALVALAGARPLAGGGAVLELQFRLADPGQATMLQPVRGEINEGMVPVQLVSGWLGRLRLFQPLILGGGGR